MTTTTHERAGTCPDCGKPSDHCCDNCGCCGCDGGCGCYPDEDEQDDADGYCHACAGTGIG